MLRIFLKSLQLFSPPLKMINSYTSFFYIFKDSLEKKDCVISLLSSVLLYLFWIHVSKTRNHIHYFKFPWSNGFALIICCVWNFVSIVKCLSYCCFSLLQMCLYGVTGLRPAGETGSCNAAASQAGHAGTRVDPTGLFSWRALGDWGTPGSPM